MTMITFKEGILTCSPKDRNPVIMVEDEVFVHSHQIGWIIGDDGKLSSITPNFVAEHNHEVVFVQVSNWTRPILLNDRVIIRLK